MLMVLLSAPSLASLIPGWLLGLKNCEQAQKLKSAVWFEEYDNNKNTHRKSKF